jgi:hypothetical protein
MFQHAQLIRNSQRHFLYSISQSGHYKDEFPLSSTYNKKKALTLV